MSIKTIILLTGALVCLLLFTTMAPPATDAKEGPMATATIHDTHWYTIQVSSFKKAQEAATEVAILETHGLTAISSYEAVKGKGMWYRVYVGRFGTREEAETTAFRLKAEGIISGYWIKILEDSDVLPISPESDRVERMTAEKDESTGQKGPQVPSDKPVEPPVSLEDQVKAPSPPIRAKSESTNLIEPSDETAGKPIEEASRQIPTYEFESEEENLFSVTLKLGIVSFPRLGKFRVFGPIRTWYLEKEYLSGAIAPSFCLNESLCLEGSLENVINAKFDFWYATLGPKLWLTTSSRDALFNLSPYVRGALAWGDMSWDGLPGSFDSSLGWELGIGLDAITIHSSLKLGLETSYRGIAFDYNVPSGLGVTSRRGKVDFSGFFFSSFLRFGF